MTILRRENMCEFSVRAVIRGNGFYVLDGSARDWCYDQLRKDEADYPPVMTDTELCRSVLTAWKNIAEDKGTL